MTAIPANLTWPRRLLLAALALCAYLIGFQPTWFVRDAVLNAFGAPAYEGVWILIPHLFLYSTLSAVFCAIAWFALVRAGWLKPPSFALSVRTLLLGIGAGLASFGALVAFFYVTGQMGAFHEPRINPWIMGANLFSNFFEELIFRGFILAALAAAFGFWPAALLSSIAFASVHSQFPLELQAVVALAGFFMALSLRWAHSLMAPYLAHMTLDWLADPLL
ncbi:MAG: type II CAAX endopeptidase family protein [Hyphomonadaceae bacterium]